MERGTFQDSRPAPRSFPSSEMASLCQMTLHGSPMRDGARNAVRPFSFQVIFIVAHCHVLDSGIIHIDVFGRSYIIINSYRIARELLEKRATIYSDRYCRSWACLWCIDRRGTHYYTTQTCICHAPRPVSSVSFIPESSILRRYIYQDGR